MSSASSGEVDHMTKICSFCREAIHEAARKCPRCQQWQGWYRFFVYAPAVICFLLIAGMQYRFGRLFDAHREEIRLFDAHRQEIRVLESSMRYGADGACAGLSTIGRIQNDGDVMWENPVIEVRYFDQAGNLIDTQTERKYIVLPPHEEVAFVLLSKAARPEAEYARHHVEVKAARDARSLTFF